MRICGRTPHKVEMVIITPDFVVSVTYQMMAYWTREEPNREIVWLDTNKTVLFTHALSFSMKSFQKNRTVHPDDDVGYDSSHYHSKTTLCHQGTSSS
jgi:hypothetical protein